MSEPLKDTVPANGIVPNVPEHTQIICFRSGGKKTIFNVIRIDEGEVLKLTTRSGHEFLIPKEDVKWTERYVESRNQNEEELNADQEDIEGTEVKINVGGYTTKAIYNSNKNTVTYGWYGRDVTLPMSKTGQITDIDGVPIGREIL